MSKDETFDVYERCLDAMDALNDVIKYFDAVEYEGPKYDAILCASGALYFLSKELITDLSEK